MGSPITSFNQVGLGKSFAGSFPEEAPRDLNGYYFRSTTFLAALKAWPPSTTSL